MKGDMDALQAFTVRFLEVSVLLFTFVQLEA